MCVHSTFACGDISGPLKMNRGKDFVEKFLQHAEGEAIVWNVSAATNDRLLMC